MDYNKHTAIISIIVPCYNQGKYLDDALQSVLNQTYTHWECIIVNDGSTDNTEEIAERWLKDKRFKYIYQENKGLCDARNIGISKALGTYILPLDADDKIGKEYINFALHEFEKDHLLKVVYCNAEKFEGETGTWKLNPFSLEGLARYNMIFCSALFKKYDWKQVGGYDIHMKYGLEDWEFWIALLKNGGSVKKLQYLGFFYRIKEQSMIKALDEIKRNELFNYMSVKHADFYVTQLGSFHKLDSKFKQLAKKHKSLKTSKKQLLKYLLKTFNFNRN